MYSLSYLEIQLSKYGIYGQMALYKAYFHCSNDYPCPQDRIIRKSKFFRHKSHMAILMFPPLDNITFGVLAGT